jgi:hypothetical protein
LATVFGQQLTVTVDSVGLLGQQLPDSIRYTMSSLKICGPLNGSDLRIIQLITNRLKAKKSNETVLTELDLSEATIVEGKGKHFDPDAVDAFLGEQAQKEIKETLATITED